MKNEKLTTSVSEVTIYFFSRFIYLFFSGEKEERTRKYFFKKKTKINSFFHAIKSNKS